MMQSETAILIMDLISAALSHATVILSISLVIIVASCFLGRYITLSRKLVLSSCGIFVISILYSLIFGFFLTEDINNEIRLDFSVFLSIIIHIYAFVLYLIVFKEKRIRRAIEAFICMYVFNIYISTLSQLIVVYCNGGTYESMSKLYMEEYATGLNWLLIISLTFILTAALFVITYFGFYRPKKLFVIPVPYRILFVIWSAFFVTVPYFPAMLEPDIVSIDQRYEYMSLFFAMGILLLGLIAPVFLIVFATERILKSKNKYQESYLTAELEYINQYKKQQTETRSFRHDIKNNLTITQMMIDEGHIEEAKEHIKDMLGNVSSLSQKYATGDDMLDIIVSMKADRMEELGIGFTLDGVVDGGLKMKPMDMCSIFANALDNAIEAACDCENPSVSLNIKRTDKFFIIKITNTTNGKVDINKVMSSSGYTSKKDKEQHGFGLLNIRHAVEEYNGVLKAESADDSFTLSIMMPRPEK